ncbi:hypothetical protein BT67DRAFT_451532 [Trichocladium antarcticum]|uniref:Uncharacterized protein n=1 Tax=Trichocladium antarcticum TaxID=1450529 RepID=A0AAN6UF74_9PEZI|nr:hypothetical protein BT67DRAFT_451532 [Trichocladium antarcticum]
MGKPSKRADPLRAAVSRVEKSRAAPRDSRSLPPWYYRVIALHYNGAIDVEPWDFDTDLSELEEEEEEEEEERGDVKEMKEEEGDDCECDGDDAECTCQSETESVESERSYDGSDADDYYFLKESREERKLEKLPEREERQQTLDFVRAREEEVRAAYKSLDKTIAIDSPARDSFRLFCTDHAEHFYHPSYYPTKRVDFYHHDLDDEDNPYVDRMKFENGTDVIYGDIYLDVNTRCSFEPFRLPKHASREAVKVRGYYRNGTSELSFRFLGNGYLTLSIPREIVFMGCARGPPPTAPEVFEFAGILPDREKERKEDAERFKMLSERSSYRETWFEMNHPMGLGRQGFMN